MAHWSDKFKHESPPYYLVPFLGILSPRVRPHVAFSLLVQLVLMFACYASNSPWGYAIGAVYSCLLTYVIVGDLEIEKHFRTTFYLLALMFVNLHAALMAEGFFGLWWLPMFIFLLLAIKAFLILVVYAHLRLLGCRLGGYLRRKFQ